MAVRARGSLLLGSDAALPLLSLCPDTQLAVRALSMQAEQLHGQTRIGSRTPHSPLMPGGLVTFL